MEGHTREQLISEHLAAIRQLEAQAAGREAHPSEAGWPPDGYYLLWHVLVGMVLGFIGAAVSLAFNAVGAPLAGEHPLQLIRVFLTFPMGEAALHASSGQVLTVGCILYLVTGGLYGVAFHLIMSSVFTHASIVRRCIAGTAMGLLLWIVNFYLILSWLQPMLMGRAWIVEMVPWWVAGATHLVFAWTMLLISSWGRFDPSTHRATLIVLLVVFATAVNAEAQADTLTPAVEAKDAAPATQPMRSKYTGDQWSTVRPGEHTQYNQRQSLRFRGKLVYERYCIGCHGKTGEGNGAAADRLITKPRDFTKGIFKFRSTDSSSLPMERDLYRTITRGLSRVSMPAFPLMPEHDKLAVITYVKSFYPAWDEEAPLRKAVNVPRAPQDLREPQRAQRGRAVYLSVGCASCHGTDGAGSGATRITYVDAWGHAQMPFNFTKGRLKNGDDPEDIYRTFHTGLRSIMPEFGASSMTSVTRESMETVLADEQKKEVAAVMDQFPANSDAAAKMSDSERETMVERNSWDLVSYVLSLRKEGSRDE